MRPHPPGADDAFTSGRRIRRGTSQYRRLMRSPTSSRASSRRLRLTPGQTETHDTRPLSFVVAANRLRMLAVDRIKGERIRDDDTLDVRIIEDDLNQRPEPAV